MEGSRKERWWRSSAAAASGLLQAGKKVVLMVEVKIALMLMVLIPQDARQL